MPHMPAMQPPMISAAPVRSRIDRRVRLRRIRSASSRNGALAPASSAAATARAVFSRSAFAQIAIGISVPNEAVMHARFAFAMPRSAGMNDNISSAASTAAAHAAV